MRNSPEVRTPSARAQTITRRTYSRPLEGGGFETWDDIVGRVIGHQRWLWQRALGDRPLDAKQENELEELREVLLARSGSVSGRTLWLGGTEVAKRREASMFNCAFTKIETTHDVVDAFWLLLQGCGVGFEPIVGTLNGFTKPMEIQVVRSQRHLLEQKKGRETNAESYASEDGKVIWTISVGDSAEAWAKSVGKMLAGKRAADVLRLDFTQIRPAGQRLKGYGWISSGDETFAPAMQKIAEVLNARAGSLLSRIDILDVLNHLGTTLSSRRSAEIALVPYGDVEWEAFATAKKDFWVHNNYHRQQSNNSLTFHSKPTKNDITDLFALMQASGGSEPGFINFEEGKRRAPWMSGVNPSLRAGTRVYTTKGFIPIEQLQDKSFVTLTPDGTHSVARCWLSSEKEPLWKLTLDNGVVHYATAQHEWPVADGTKKRTDQLSPSDAIKFGGEDELPFGTEGNHEEGFLVGYTFGNGWLGSDYFGLCVPLKRADKLVPRLTAQMQTLGLDVTFRAKQQEANSLEFTTRGTAIVKWFAKWGWAGKDALPASLWTTASEDFRKGFIEGLFRADGYYEKKAKRIGISNKSETVLRELQILLGAYRLPFYLSSFTHKELHINGHVYADYTIWSLRAGAADTINRFVDLFGIKGWRVESVRKTRLIPVTLGVRSCELTDLEEPVWDISVLNENHAFSLGNCFTGNCAEILLPNKGFCNLVEINLSHFNGKNAMKLWRTAELLARANYRQTCVNLVDGILQRAWHENNEFLRLCGVGVTGVAEWEPAGDPAVWRMLRDKVKRAAWRMADELRLPRPKAVTTVKPSGTLSKIMDTTEGVHKPLGRYIFNNVRFSKHDPYVQELIDANYRVFQDPSSPDAVLVTFPVAYPNVKMDEVDGKFVNLEPAIVQLDRYKSMMDNYVDHNCSVTISYSPDETPEIVDWLFENWGSYVGVSFLYRTDPTKTAQDLGYLYLPQEVVTKEAYEAYVATLKPLSGGETGAQAAQNADEEYEIDAGGECAGGACPVR